MPILGLGAVPAKPSSICRDDLPLRPAGDVPLRRTPEAVSACWTNARDESAAGAPVSCGHTLMSVRCRWGKFGRAPGGSDHLASLGRRGGQSTGCSLPVSPKSRRVQTQFGTQLEGGEAT